MSLTSAAYPQACAGADAQECAAAPAREDFTACMRQIPGAVAVVATACAGERRGLIATSWCSVSAEPPSILVCVSQGASAHDVIRRAGFFSVNPLTTDHAEIMAIFAGQRGLSGDARFNHGDWRTGASGAPVLQDALASLECHLAEHYAHHSHSIFIGRVTHLRVTPQAEALIYAKRAAARAVALA
jgi:flavin reductase (NADH)/cob(II)yrinic acid a,c-diamide reductase